MKAEIINAFNLSSTSSKQLKKMSVTELDRDLSYVGLVDSFEDSKGKTVISLINVEVFEYSSATPLYNVSNFKIERPTQSLFVEEISSDSSSEMLKKAL